MRSTWKKEIKEISCLQKQLQFEKILFDYEEIFLSYFNKLHFTFYYIDN